MANNGQRVIQLHKSDNVVVALDDLPKGGAIPNTDFVSVDPVKRGHKIAIAAVETGKNVIRYGQIIGVASQPIAPGEHVHTHNLEMGSHKQDYAFCSNAKPVEPVSKPATFMGFHRSDGRVGTRNYLGILTTVNCAGSVARFIADAAERSDWLPGMENIDGIVPIVHGSGCGMSGKHEGFDLLMRTLTGYAQHPNFAGILLVGLGCEVLQIPDLMGAARLRDKDSFRYMTIQQTGGTRQTVEKGVAILRELAQSANKISRTPASAAHLSVGLQCGGSDGYSGITANPALSHASDLLVQHGGTTILAETPEIYGAEHLLTRRAATPEVGEKLVERIKWWEEYTAKNGGEMDNNPSPGNKRGGLTTILEKSLGAVAKGGTAPLVGVYGFAEPVTRNGFVFMDSPGYDPVSVTGQIASGANLIAFTTGRGSVSGFMPTPSLKFATNTEMYDRMSEDMDMNCGDIISDGVSLATKGQQIFDLFLATASGQKTKSEELGFGGAEFLPWQMGAVM